VRRSLSEASGVPISSSASPLCAIATVSDDGSGYANTAYFAVSARFAIVWLSCPSAAHSGNIRARARASIAVYESAQTWGGADRGIQLFGEAEELASGSDVLALDDYAARFPALPRPRHGRPADLRSATAADQAVRRAVTRRGHVRFGGGRLGRAADLARDRRLPLIGTTAD